MCACFPCEADELQPKAHECPPDEAVKASKYYAHLGVYLDYDSDCEESGLPTATRSDATARAPLATEMIFASSRLTSAR